MAGTEISTCFNIKNLHLKVTKDYVVKTQHKENIVIIINIYLFCFRHVFASQNEPFLNLSLEVSVVLTRSYSQTLTFTTN